MNAIMKAIDEMLAKFLDIDVKRTGLVLGIEPSDNTVGEDDVKARVPLVRRCKQSESAYRLLLQW